MGKERAYKLVGVAWYGILTVFAGGADVAWAQLGGATTMTTGTGMRPGKMGECCWDVGCASFCEGSLVCRGTGGPTGPRVCSAPTISSTAWCVEVAGPATRSGKKEGSVAGTLEGDMKVFGTGVTTKATATLSKSGEWSLSRIGTDAEMNRACASKCPQSGVTGSVTATCTASFGGTREYSLGFEIPGVGAGAKATFSAQGVISKTATKTDYLTFTPECPGVNLETIAKEKLAALKESVCSNLVLDMLGTARFKKK